MTFSFRLTGSLGTFHDPATDTPPVDGVVCPFQVECERCGEVTTWDRLPVAAELKREIVKLAVEHRTCRAVLT